MDIAIIGAAGDCGRQMAARIAGEGLVPPNGRLQLVGRAGGRSEAILQGLAADIEDASAEAAPELDVCADPREVFADLVVFTAGAGSFNIASDVPPRDQLAAANAPIFLEYAEAIAAHGSGQEVILVVTNPVELGVEIFARRLGRHRVLGVGAYSDTMRFRREIARDFGVRRQRVQGFVLGEHGDAMVPAWSTVGVHGMSRVDIAEAMPRAARDFTRDDWDAELSAHKGPLRALMQAGRVREAVALVDGLPPDIRVLLRPFVTQTTGAKTAFTTAATVVEFLHGLLAGRGMVAACQAVVEGEFHGLRGVLGVPVLVGEGGIVQFLDMPLSPGELERLAQTAESVESKLSAWLSDEGGRALRSIPYPERPSPEESGACDKRLHALHIRARNRPGTIETITSAFGRRGISLEYIGVVRRPVGEHSLEPTVELSFRATDLLRDQMVGILRRMRCVDTVSSISSQPGEEGPLNGIVRVRSVEGDPYGLM